MDAKLLAFPQGAHPWAEEDGRSLGSFQDLCRHWEGTPLGQDLAQQQWLDKVDVLGGGGDVLHLHLQAGGDLDDGPAHCGKQGSAPGTQ